MNQQKIGKTLKLVEIIGLGSLILSSDKAVFTFLLRSPRTALFWNEVDQAAKLKNREPPMEKVNRPPTSLKNLPRNLKDSDCYRTIGCSQEFCDVLGPGSCNACLEFANRKIAGEHQKSGFPALDYTVTTLVAPKLAKVMASGDKYMRKNNKDLRRGAIFTRGRRGATGVDAGERARSSGGGILRLPSVGNEENTKFYRAGVEKWWESKAKKYFAHSKSTLSNG